MAETLESKSNFTSKKAKPSLNKSTPQSSSSFDPSPYNKQALIEVWRRTLQKWNPFDDKIVKPALILAYSYPIPTELRSEVWFIISGARDLMRKNRNVFQHLCQQLPPNDTNNNNNTQRPPQSNNTNHDPPPMDTQNKHEHAQLKNDSNNYNKCIEAIEKDLMRTFGNKNSNKKYQSTLRKVLTAYANFDPTTGYTQGMNYIAGFLLIQYMEHTPFEAPQKTTNDNDNNNDSDEYEIVNNNNNNSANMDDDMDSDLLTFIGNDMSLIEEKAFWTFAAIINKISTLFCDRLPGFHKSVECFSKLFKYHGPTQLVTHLSSLNVYPIVLTGWFHSMFTYPSMNVNISRRIWDVFIVERMDFSILLKIAYLIIIRHESQLIKMDFVEIIEFCKSNNCFIFNNKDDHDLIYRASKLQLNELYLTPIRNLKYVEILGDTKTSSSPGKYVKNNKNKNKNRKRENGYDLKGSHWRDQNRKNGFKLDDVSDADSVNSVGSVSPTNGGDSSSFVKLSNENNKSSVNAIDEDKEESDKSWMNLLTFGFVQ